MPSKNDFHLVRVTPELAKKWLQNTVPNRTISRQVVERYIRDMQNDSWEINGETIKFRGQLGEDLVDGRHRLTACQESGCNFTTFVATGIVNFSEIDIGRRRTLADAVAIFGSGIDVPYALALDGAVNMLLSYARRSRARVAGTGSGTPGHPLTHREKLKFILENQLLAKIMPEIREYMVKNTPLRPSVAVVLCWLAAFANHSLGSVHEFLRGVRDGVDLSNGSPALAYRNFLINSATRGRGVSAREALRAGITALNNHLSGKYVKQSKVAMHVEFDGAEPSEVAVALGLVNPAENTKVQAA